MAADKKTLERINKLLRLAAPDSNSTEPERASAALEAARLISSHDLVVANRSEADRPDRRAPERPRRGGGVSAWNMHRRSTPHWMQSVATRPVRCEDCGGVIAPGNNVWAKTGGEEYVHRSVYL